MLKNYKNKLYIIAETACSHDGSVIRLKKLINAASKAKANAVQFQVWRQSNIITPKDPSKKKLKSIEISKKNWTKIFNYTKKKFKKLDIIACIYDVDALNFCNKLGASAFKIHSSDLGNFELLNAVAKTGKRVDLSIGGSTIKEIKKALQFFKQKNVWLMYGYQLFPTKPDNLNILKVKKYEKIFNLPVGYQDHSPPYLSGISIPTLAIGTGVNIIEKHITDYRIKSRTDAEAAFTPKEFEIFVQKCLEAKKAIGTGKIEKLNADEIAYREYSKKKIYAAHLIEKNSIIQRADLIIRRPITKKGIIVDDISKVLGKK